MKVTSIGAAVIRHRQTGAIYTVDATELDWDQVGGDERQMGTELHYEAVVEHPQLGTLTWGLWEYPIGIENHHLTHVNGHELITDVRYELEHVREPD